MSDATGEGPQGFALRVRPRSPGRRNARETELPDDPPSGRDRFRGCLLAGAVGDAVGAPVEFMSRAEILRLADDLLDAWMDEPGWRERYPAEPSPSDSRAHDNE